MDFLLLALVLVAPFGAIRGYRSVHSHGLRWGIERHAASAQAKERAGAYRGEGTEDRYQRRAVPALVQAAAMLAGAGQFGSYGLVALGFFYALAVLVSGAPWGIVLSLSFGLTLPPLAMGYAFQRYLRALVEVQEHVPSNVDGAVLVVGVVFTPLVLSLAAVTNDPRWLVLGLPVLGIVLVFAGAAQMAQAAARAELTRQAEERSHLEPPSPEAEPSSETARPR